MIIWKDGGVGVEEKEEAVEVFKKFLIKFVDVI